MPYEFAENEFELEPEASSAHSGGPPGKLTGIGILDPPVPPRRPPGPIPALPVGTCPAQNPPTPPPKPQPAYTPNPAEIYSNPPEAAAAKRARLLENEKEFRQGVERLYQLTSDLRSELQKTPTAEVFSVHI